MRKILFTLITLVCITHTQASDEPVTLTTPTGDIHGRIMLPDDCNAPCPVVLIIAGSGPTDMDGNSINMGTGLKNNSLLFLARELAANGIASLRYDKRGIGTSMAAAKSEADLRFDHYIDDAAAWANMLAADSRFSKVIIAGHSEGSLIGMVAAQRSKSVDAYISIAGCGSPAYEVLEKQLQGQMNFVREGAMAIDLELRQGRTVDNVPNYLASLYRPSVQPYIISWYKYNPATEIAKLTMPVLILQGDKDIQVGIEEAERLSAAKPEAPCFIIEGMNHILKQCDSMEQRVQIQTYNDPTLPINPELVAKIVEFVK